MVLVQIERWIGWLGGVPLNRTWTCLFFGLTFLGLVVRARREEEALQAEFGEEWLAYSRRVPGWLPRLLPLKILIHKLPKPFGASYEPGMDEELES